MTTAIENIHRLALEACDGLDFRDRDGDWILSPGELARFAELVRADAEAKAHAAIDASPAKIVRNRLDGYPGIEDRILTLVERIAALDRYAADWKRWCMEAERKAALVRADERERCAKLCERFVDRTAKYSEAEFSAGAEHCAAAIRALKDAP